MSAIYRRIVIQSEFGNFQSIKPLAIALEFIRTQETDLLEMLHPEYREIVLEIVTKVDPSIIPPQQIHG